jgi:hypothetical protein
MGFARSTSPEDAAVAEFERLGADAVNYQRSVAVSNS